MPGKYAQLIAQFPLRPIRTDRQLRRASDVAWHLAVQARLSRDEQDYLDVLSDLISAYEEEQHAIEPATDADMLRHLLEARGVTQAQLSQEAGIAKSTISEVLAGKKPFSRQVIRKLADYFKVDVGILAGNL